MIVSRVKHEKPHIYVEALIGLHEVLEVILS